MKSSWDGVLVKAGENCKSKPSAVCIVIFSRGLHTHRYFCVALKGFWQRAESEGFILVVHKKPGFLRYSLLVGREIKREKWLTGRSTFRK